MMDIYTRAGLPGKHLATYYDNVILTTTQFFSGQPLYITFINIKTLIYHLKYNFL